MMRKTEKLVAGMLVVPILLQACAPSGPGPDAASPSFGRATQALSSAPEVGPEKGMDEPLISGLLDDVENMALAGSASGYLGVWQQDGDVYAARITREGEVLDVLPIRVGATGFDDKGPAVGSDGTDYLVCWHTRNVLFCSRVSATGVVQEQPTLVAQSSYADIPVSIAATDGVYLVASTRLDNGSFVEARRVRADTGELLDPQQPLVSFELASRPAVAAKGGMFLLTFRDRRSGNWDVFGARITPQGAVQDETPFVICQGEGNQQLPAVASDGSVFLVTFVDSESTLGGSDGDFRSVVVRDDGTLSQPCGKPVVARRSWNEWPASIAFTGDGYHVAWETQTEFGSRDVLAGRLDASGALVGTPVQVDWDPYYEIQPVVASSNLVPMIGFIYDNAVQNRGPHFKAVRLNAEGAVVDRPSLRIGASANWQRAPLVATSNGRYLVAWTDMRSSLFSSRVFGARVDAQTGESLDPNGISLLTDEARAGAVGLAAAGDVYLVSYVDQAIGNTVQGQRIDQEGQRLGPPVALSTATASSTKVASNDDVFLVVWIENEDGETVLRGRRMKAADGSVLDPTPLQITVQEPVSGNGTSSFDVASDGTDFLVVWMGNDLTNLVPIYGQRIRGSDGIRMDARDTLLTTSDGYHLYPKVVFGGGHYLVSYLDFATTMDQVNTSMALRVAPDGTIRDQLGFPLWVGGSVRVAWDGRSFPLLQLRPGSTTETFRGLALAELGPDGRPYPEGAEVELAPNALDDTQAIACNNAGDRRADCLAVYVRNAAGVPRVHSRRFSFNKAPVAEPLVVETSEDEPVGLELVATDTDGDPLTFTWTTPSHGTLSGTAPELTYTPAADFHGSDSFTFQVSDGTRTTEPVQVSIEITPVNDAPVASAATHFVDEDGEVAISLVATDVDGDPLTFLIVRGPTHGELVGLAPDFVYSPAADFHGTDAFEFTVFDGQLSAAAKVDLVVRSVVDAPVALAQTVYLAEDVTLDFELKGTSAEGEDLTFEVVGAPQHGGLIGVAPTLRYTPAENWQGVDVLTFTVSTPSATSAPATVTFVVEAVNDAPKARSTNVAAQAGTRASIILEAEDVDGDELEFTILEFPTNGILAGQPPNLTYTPRAGFAGQDAFTFSVSDGRLQSEGKVLIGVVEETKVPSDGSAADEGGCSATGAPASFLLLAALGLLRRQRSQQRA